MIYPDLILNKKNWERLFISWNRGKLPHALLFQGPSGSGKEGHALELAALLNCASTKNERPCGSCSSCKKTKSFQHENVKLILPLPRGKISSRTDAVIKAFSEKALAEYLDMLKEKGVNPYFSIRVPGANTILINSIRELKHDIYMSTVNNEWIIILVFQAEKLCLPSPVAAHALLKMLEEPPERTLFILVSSQSEAILDTIRSRCQSLYFPPIPTQSIQEKLMDSGLDQVQASMIARVSGGNLKVGMELAENSNHLMNNLLILVQACFSDNPADWEKAIETTVNLKRKNIGSLEQLFHSAVLFFRDILYYSSTGSDDEIIFSNQMRRINEFSSSHPHADWQACIQHIENTLNYILRNGYLPLMITNLILDIQKSSQGEYHQPFQLRDWTPV